MNAVITHDMLVRRALSFLEERRRERPELPLEKLLDEAGARFNLSPVLPGGYKDVLHSCG